MAKQRNRDEVTSDTVLEILFNETKPKISYQMPGNYRKPTDKKNKEIPFKIEVEGKEYTGTLAESGEPIAFGVPSAFIVRIPGEPRMMVSIYRGEWQMQAKPEFAKALGEWIDSYFQ